MKEHRDNYLAIFWSNGWGKETWAKVATYLCWYSRGIWPRIKRRNGLDRAKVINRLWWGGFFLVIFRGQTLCRIQRLWLNSWALVPRFNCSMPDSCL